MHPIVTNINKSVREEKKKGQVHEDRTHLLYKRIIFDIRRRKKKKKDEIK